MMRLGSSIVCSAYTGMTAEASNSPIFRIMVEVLSHLEADDLLRFRVIEELRRTLLLDS
jgi:hypothetical protein